jgi:hypothetical protein
MRQDSSVRAAPSPALPRKRGREQTEHAARERTECASRYPARLRSTKQAPPARRMLPHRLSAAARVSAPTRTW